MAYLMGFSGGRSSALAMRLMTINGIPKGFHIVFANTGKERDETLDFVHRCEVEWGLPIVWVEGVYNPYKLEEQTMVSSIGFKIVNYETAKRRSDKDTPFEKMIDWVNCGIVPNRASRFCTKYLKIVPMQRYMESIGAADYTLVMGIRYDEPERIVKHPDAILPLVPAKITQPQVRKWFSQQPFDLQLKDYEGNCDVCYLKSLRKRLTILWEHPEFAPWWSDQEVKTKSTFQQGKSIDDILKRASLLKFRPVKDLFELSENSPQLFELDENAPPMFGEDMDISCYCGD
jgi:hypothetical protein